MYNIYFTTSSQIALNEFPVFYLLQICIFRSVSYRYAPFRHFVNAFFKDANSLTLRNTLGFKCTCFNLFSTQMAINLLSNLKCIISKSLNTHLAPFGLILSILGEKMTKNISAAASHVHQGAFFP